MMNSSSNEGILPSITHTHSTHHRNTICVPRGQHQGNPKKLHLMHPSSGAGCAEERSDDTKTVCQQLTYRSADSEFIILGPGRARAQNSSESRNFGVIKKSTLPKCSAQRNRLGAFPGPIESYDPKDGACKRSSQTNSWLARYFHLKGTKNTNNLVTRKIKLSRPQYYSSSEKGFPSHF